MTSRRAERVVRGLTGLFSFAFFLLLILGGVVLLGLPIAKVATDGTDWVIGLPVPVEAPAAEGTRVATRWGDATLELEDVRGTLRLPVALLPWGAFATVWLYTAAGLALALLFLHHLRRLFQRVRDGAPFDPGNAGRLRWMGALAIGYALLGALGQLATALAVAAIEGDAFRLMVGVPGDGSPVVMGLVLLALAEVFRRGAEMEADQALVI